jgi:hypothetical protein
MRDGQWTDISHNGWKATHFGNAGLLAREGQPRMIGSGPTLRFDGEDDHVELALRQFGGVHTFSCWVKRDEQGEWARVFQFGRTASSNADSISIVTITTTENMKLTLTEGGTIKEVDVPDVMYVTTC